MDTTNSIACQLDSHLTEIDTENIRDMDGRRTQVTRLERNLN